MKPKMKMLALKYSGPYKEWDPMEGADDLESYRRKYKVEKTYPSSKIREKGEMPRVIGFAANERHDKDYSTGATTKSYDKYADWESDDMPVDKEIAERWTRGMRNEDGTKGPHWTIDQVRGVMAQRGINLDPWEFYVAINMVYSDYYKVLKKYGVGDKLDVYADLASAFLKDKDAAKDKLARYFEYVVKG
jgi:hypothetical protein